MEFLVLELCGPGVCKESLTVERLAEFQHMVALVKRLALFDAKKVIPDASIGSSHPLFILSPRHPTLREPVILFRCTRLKTPAVPICMSCVADVDDIRPGSNLFRRGS